MKRSVAAQRTADVTETAAPTPEPVEKPAEEAAAVALRERLRTFNEGAPTRAALTDEDRAALDAFKALAVEYAEAASEAWKGNVAPWHAPLTWGATTPPDVVTGLGALISTYLIDSTDEQVTQLASGRTKTWPAIESDAYRRNLAKDGEAIIQRINSAIEAGYKRIADAHAAERKLRDRVQFWLGFPLVHQLVATLAMTVDSRPELNTGRTRTLTALRAELQSVALAEERAGRKVPEQIWGHDWRAWLPVAREILAKDGDNNPAKA
jgi:hypothetical protein